MDYTKILGIVIIFIELNFIDNIQEIGHGSPIYAIYNFFYWLIKIDENALHTIIKIYGGQYSFDDTL